MTTTTEAATILVVDDDPDCREIAARLLERAGYRTRRAASGEECMRIALAEPIDVVLLDVMMPGMDGFAVCEALRQAGQRIPIILLTASDEMIDRALPVFARVRERALASPPRPPATLRRPSAAP